MDIKVALRESLMQMDLFHLQDALFQYFSLDEIRDSVDAELRHIISDVDSLNRVTSQPERFLRFENSKTPRKRALYLISAKFLEKDL